MNHRLSYSMKLARACVAVAVAYALALQVLLASVTAASMAMTPAADAAVICYGSGNTSGNPQPSHSPSFADCALACAQGLSASAVLPSDISFAFISTTDDQGEHGLAAAFVVSQRSSPKLAQGPPQSV